MVLKKKKINKSASPITEASATAQPSTDGLVIIVTPDFKVHRGVVGWVEWCMHGRLSRFILEGRYSGEHGSWLHVGLPFGMSSFPVVLGGCSIDDPSDLKKKCQKWYAENQYVWKKLGFKRMKWSLSEEWLPHQDVWGSVLAAEDFVSFDSLKGAHG